MNIQSSPYLSAVQQNNQITSRGYVSEQNRSLDVSFSQMLEKTSSLKFSKHATSRLEERNINLTEEQLGRLNSAADKAGGKGIKESLVLIDDMAFIVSTNNSTVITAAMQNQTKDSIFTNIDGAVIG